MTFRDNTNILGSYYVPTIPLLQGGVLLRFRVSSASFLFLKLSGSCGVPLGKWFCCLRRNGRLRSLRAGTRMVGLAIGMLGASDQNPRP